MDRTATLKKIRKEMRKNQIRNRVQAFEYFWREIRETGYKMRLMICWTILFYPREKRKMVIKQANETAKAPNN